MPTPEPAPLERYRRAVDALAAQVFAAVELPGARDDTVDRALAALRAVERSADSEHRWIFSDPEVLLLSENLFEGLDARPEDRREWLHAHLASAVAAVARFDVMSEVIVQMGIAAEALAEREPAASGKA